MTEIIELYQAALFARRPRLGEINPPGEVRYAGYKRVPVAVLRSNLHAIVFPCSEQTEPVFAEAVALMDGKGVVAAVRTLGRQKD